MVRLSRYLPFTNAVLLLGALIAVLGTALVVAAGSPGRAPTLAFAALWSFLGIRIWMKWGWEERFSIPACFVLSILTLAAGLS